MDALKAMYSGRLGRWHFFLLFVLTTLASVGLHWLWAFLIPATAVVTSVFAIFVVVAEIALLIVIAFFTWHLYVRRFHDMGMSGWWVIALILIPLVPLLGGLLGWIALILLCLLPGTTGTNDYGEPPRTRGLLEAFFNR